MSIHLGRRGRLRLALCLPAACAAVGQAFELETISTQGSGRATGEWSKTLTLGNAYDNRGGPALTVDSEGYLHAIYHSHSGAFRYRNSPLPNDSSAWADEELVGARLTYPSTVAGPDDTLYVIARPRETTEWGLVLHKKPKNGEWSEPTRLREAGIPVVALARLFHTIPESTAAGLLISVVLAGMSPLRRPFSPFIKAKQHRK